MEWFVALIVGGLVGWAVIALFRQSNDEDMLSHIALGAIGGLVGKLLMSYIWVVGSYTIGSNFNLYSVLWAIAGGLVFAGLWRAMTLTANGRQRIGV